MMSLRASISSTATFARRCFSVNVPACTAVSDPIQGLFVEKIREYGDKKAAGEGKMVDATAATEAELQNELDKVAKAYGGGAGIDMAAFPELSFEDPAMDPINVSA
eukprot:GFUD01027055.1.p1 GENE.GFUD01027055.1~~GFUD01027055.1.p1  ORF type:complete len:106 (+),score=29.95 GFUD01027055.1:67-384(+)